MVLVLQLRCICANGIYCDENMHVGVWEKERKRTVALQKIHASLAWTMTTEFVLLIKCIFEWIEKRFRYRHQQTKRIAWNALICRIHMANVSMRCSLDLNAQILRPFANNSSGALKLRRISATNFKASENLEILMN